VCLVQVELAQTEYQLPRLTRMWTHLERQAGGLVKGMGEKQIEVDKRILRTQVCHDESQQCLLTHSHIRCHLFLTLSTPVT
jgi:50S ribosomal subunit-associated GTPase HflX